MLCHDKVALRRLVNDQGGAEHGRVSAVAHYKCIRKCMETNQELLDISFLQQAIEQGRSGMRANQGGPFGCIVVKDGQVIGRGNNKVTTHNDPTAHAEVVAIREACQFLNSFQLEGCVLYTSCEPCPMCLGAIYWARPDRMVFAASRLDAAYGGFDDDFIYRELVLPLEQRSIPTRQLLQAEARQLFDEWLVKPDKVPY